MATSDNSIPAATDLLAVIERAGVLTDRQFEEVRARVLRGDYPFDATGLTRRLVHDGLLTDFQVRRILKNKVQGLTIGRYVILDRLGAGSMGRVYKARHQMMGRLVALKIIAPEVASNERVVKRFQREMKLVGRLDHPNVVRAFDADRFGETLYIVMEYVAGESLGQRLMTKGPIPAIEVVSYGAQAARGLAHAHHQGIIHRDVKPSNLLLTTDRQVKVLDLGLSVLMEADQHATFATADGVAVGTLDYMSPEQATGQELDTRTDIYSLGCTMYHLMTGRMPFPGEHPIERLGRRIKERPVPLTEHLPDLPSKVVQVMDKLMATRPEDRFQTAEEAAEALQTLIKRKGTPSRSRTLETAPPPPSVIGEPAASGPTSVPPPSPSPAVVTVAPTYPAWFRPLATMAEHAPLSALATVLTLLTLAFAAGFGVAFLLLG